MSKFVSQAMIKEARKIDLLSYLRNYEPKELVKISEGTYSTKTHDSLIISNGLWHRFSTNEGGKNAFDYLIKVKKYSLPEAVNIILKNINISPIKFLKEEEKINRTPLIIPKKARDNVKVIEYLMNRGIDKSIIEYCILNNLIYQEDKTNNVVFLGYDNDGNIKYAGCRSTNNKRIMRDAKGSLKEFSFRLLNKENTSLHLFESSIDLLSYATLLKEKGYDWRKQNLIALSGVYQTQKDISKSKLPISIDSFLKNNKEVAEIILHFDNDLVGRNATKAFLFLLGKNYKVRDMPAPIGKDINDYLCYSLGLKNKEEIEKYKRYYNEKNIR